MEKHLSCWLLKKSCVIDEDVTNINNMIISLMDNGADIHIKDKQGMNSLLHAANNHKMDNIAKFLIEKGADPKSIDNYDNNGIHLASKNGSFNLIKLFHQYLPIDSYNKNEHTPLMLAAINVKNIRQKYTDSFYYDKEQNDYVSIVDYFLDCGANIAKRNKNNFNAFDAALIGKNDKIIKTFLANLSIRTSKYKINNTIGEINNNTIGGH
jgi:ankyrin repeat protein